jgi:hypothetical protein
MSDEKLHDLGGRRTGKTETAIGEILRGVRWTVTTRDLSIPVDAANQFEAFDALREFPRDAFGMVVEATDPVGRIYPVRTSLLMLRWNREEDAEMFRRRAITLRYGDSRAADLAALANMRKA